MKIYTKTGDKGHTMLGDGTTVPKNNTIVKIVGSFDELMAFTGRLSEELQQELRNTYNRNTLLDLFVGDSTAIESKRAEFKCVINELDTIMALIYRAMSQISCGDEDKYDILDVHIEDIEKRIDLYMGIAGELNSFIYPTGNVIAANSHCLRAICRRLETDLVSIAGFDNAKIFINRLSDYYFALARYITVFLDGNERTFNISDVPAFEPIDNDVMDYVNDEESDDNSEESDDDSDRSSSGEDSDDDIYNQVSDACKQTLKDMAIDSNEMQPQFHM